MNPTYIYRVAEVVNVHDGDTYTFRLDLGFRVFLIVIVRLHRFNCPELSNPDGSGLKARDAAENLIKAAKVITVQSFKDEQSFARWVCDVYLDGVSLGETLASQGLAVVMPHFGLNS